MIGEYKGIFHSTLVGAGDVYVTVKSDVTHSKKPGKPDYVIIEHDGQDQFLNLENEKCANVMRGKKGQSLTIRGIGSRKDADIQILSADGTVRTAEAPSARPSSSGGSPQQGDPMNAYRHGLMRVLNALYANYRGMNKLAEQLEVDGIKLTPDQIQAGASTAFITLDRQGLVQSLPDKPLWSAEKQLEEKPAPEEDPW